MQYWRSKCKNWKTKCKTGEQNAKLESKMQKLESKMQKLENTMQNWGAKCKTPGRNHTQPRWLHKDSTNPENKDFTIYFQVTEEGEEQQRCPTLEQIEENVQNWGQQADPDVEEGHLEQLDDQVGDDGEHLGSGETEERPALGSYPS